jgi:hypothetical protein
LNFSEPDNEEDSPEVPFTLMQKSSIDITGFTINAKRPRRTAYPVKNPP